jgi:L-alanine-DL-glutamate epimerase-like enolase superfamily enzyme
LLDKGGTEILQTEAAVCGGITEWRRIATTAASHGVTISPHWFHDLHVHLVAATPNARYVEFFPDNRVLNFRRLIDNQLQQKDGDLLLAQTPGLGFDFEESAVKKHALDQTTPWTTIK